MSSGSTASRSTRRSSRSRSTSCARPSIINELIADAGVDNELGEVNENYYAGLDAYFAGDKDAAVESLQAVVDDQPTNTMAADFLKKAQDLPDEAASDSGGSDDGGGFPIALVGGIGAGVLVLLGLVVFLISRRGKGQGGQGGPSPAMPVGQTPGGDGGWAPQPSAPMTPTTTSSSAAPSGPYVAPATAQAAPAPQAATPPAPVTPPAPAAPTASSTPPAPPAHLPVDVRAGRVHPRQPGARDGAGGAAARSGAGTRLLRHLRDARCRRAEVLRQLRGHSLRAGSNTAAGHHRGGTGNGSAWTSTPARCPVPRARTRHLPRDVRTCPVS